MKGLHLLLFFFTIFLFNRAHAQLGNALLLDGDGDYMTVEDHNALDINAGESFSITCWVKSTTNKNYYRIISKRGGTSGSASGYELITNISSGEYGINLRSVYGTNAGPPFGTTNITDGVWHHLAMVVNPDKQQSQIYVDGNLEGTNTSSAIGTEGFQNNVNIYIGTSVNKHTYWDGWIDEIRLWSDALSQDEILADMTDSITGTEKDLIASWDFQDVSNATVPDLAGMHPGKLHGNPQIINPSASEMHLIGIEKYQPSYPTGIGQSDERLYSVNFKTIGAQDPLVLNQLNFTIDQAADKDAVSRYKVYYNGSRERLDLSTAELLGEIPINGNSLSLSISKELKEGNNIFWLCADISEQAQEGAQIGAWLSNYTMDGEERPVSTPSEPHLRTILLIHKALFSGGDYASAHYRIPAIEAVGQHVIVVADARRDDNGDLPGNIDLFCRYSNDGGKTWSDAIVVADFGENGASDPALVYDRRTGDILCLFASHNGLFYSTPSDKIRFQVARSKDMGKTWSSPKEFSDEIYQSGWYAAWAASGSAFQMANGRIIAAIGVRENSSYDLSNFMIYSDDSGYTWHTAPGRASTNGNESKIVELDDGRLLMSIRSRGSRKVAYSEDNGNTWTKPVHVPELIEPGVNGDLIRYTSVRNGYRKSRLLFSIASDPSVRRNLTVFVSYDEGKTWNTKRVICPGPAGYSALTVLDDGTIGLFYENGEYENYQLYYARFSLDWLTDGKDSWLPAVDVSDAQLKIPDFKASPNPSRSRVKISFNLEHTRFLTLEILDTAGNKVKELLPPDTYTGKQEIIWHTTGVAKGTYFITITSGNKRFTRKIILM